MNPRLVRAGDSMLAVEFEERIDSFVNARAVRLANAVRAAAIAGVHDVLPTYRAIAVYFDPLRTDYQQLVGFLEKEATQPADVTTEGRQVRVPVCYGGDLGPDLAAVAAFGNMRVEEVIDCHAGGVYRVFMLGFVPGFAYMGTVDPRIAAPRHPTPRVRVSAGTVGIAGQQTGIYPSDGPGGWQLIGRTPLKPFDLSRPNPFLLQAGDIVRFDPIDRPAYERATLNP